MHGRLCVYIRIFKVVCLFSTPSVSVFWVDVVHDSAVGVCQSFRLFLSGSLGREESLKAAGGIGPDSY